MLGALSVSSLPVIELKNNIQYLKKGLATVLGIAKRGYFIPYRYAHLIEPDRAALSWVEDLFSQHETGGFSQILVAIVDYQSSLLKIADEDRPGNRGPRFTQDWFPGLDAMAAYAILRQTAPRRVVEVGSGHSTRFMARAILDGGLTTELHCIDPAPRAEISGITTNHRALTAQDAGVSAFSSLNRGDVLFLDSSHIAMPGSDVDFLLTRVLPTLEAGVLVHIHDIFLPDPYPVDWEWRGYNEQSLVAALLGSGGFEPVFASQYVRTRMREALGDDLFVATAPPEQAFESSLWLRKLTGPMVSR